MSRVSWLGPRVSRPEEGSLPRLIDFIHHSTLGSRVIKRKKGAGCLDLREVGHPASESIRSRTYIISHQVFLKSFRKSQLHHESIDLSFTVTDVKNKLKDLCGN